MLIGMIVLFAAAFIYIGVNMVLEHQVSEILKLKSKYNLPPGVF
jgi:hypothetical protein